jgi:heme-degrading monooxygenase HmoA
MILTIFRSRLNQGIDAEYQEQIHNTAPLAEQSPGFIGHKMFTADDGEQITVVEFESMEAQRAWSLRREHRDAAKLGRKHFYAEYKIQICSVLRESKFPAQSTYPIEQSPVPREAQRTDA